MKPPPKTKNKDEPPWLQFRLCKDRCCLDTCKECGYFWGLDNSMAGQRAVFGK